MVKTKRIDWPDALRGFAVISVYLAHLGSYSQYVSLFCFSYVVPLFFFVSGLFATSYSKLKFRDLGIRLVKKLFIPYVALCAINMVYYNSVMRIPYGKMLVECIKAIRNKIFSSTLWFLPALIVMTLIYWCLSKYVKNRHAVLAICFAMSILMKIFKEPSQWYWSADSAVMYIYYYALGAYLMPILSKHIPDKLDFRVSKELLTAAGLVAASCVVSIFVFNTSVNSASSFKLVLDGVPARCFTFVISTLMIAVFIVFAVMLRRLDMLRTIGQLSLITSFIQSVSSWIFTEVCWYGGLSWSIWKDYQTVVYGLCLVLFTTYIISKPLKKLLPFVFGK